MRKTALVCYLMFTGTLAYGQLDSNSITVSVSRNSTVQPDQVVFAVSVQSGLSTGLSDVLTALQGTGITIANFGSVGTGYQNTNPYAVPPAMLTWSFIEAVPFAKMADTVASLTALQQTIAQGKNGLTLSFSVQGTQISAQLAQSQTCSLSGLISDAQAQAQNMASAAGVTVGPIIALSSATTNVVPTAPVSVGLAGFLTSSLVSSPEFAPPCAMTVKFGLFRY